MRALSINYIKEKWNHVGFQKYFKNTGWMFASRILCMGMAFVTTAFIARKLGPGNFGQLSYAVSFVSIFSVLASLGIDNILYRDLIKNPDKNKKLLGSALTIKLLAGFFTAILVCISAFWGVENDVSKILILILSATFIFNSFQIINFEFQARLKSKYPSIIILLTSLILNLLKITIIMSGKGVIYLALALLSESILYTIFYLFIYKKKLGSSLLEWKFDKQIATALLNDSWPLMFTGAFVLIYSRIDQIFIKNILDAQSVGIYSSAVNIAEIWNFIPVIVVTVLFPAIIHAKKTSEELYRIRLKNISILFFILSIGVSLLTTIFAPLLIKIIYGGAFVGAVTILKIYVWSNIGMFFGILATNYLIAENRKKMLIFITFTPMIINIIMNLIFIPKYGIVGSAYATLISYSMIPILLLLSKELQKIILLIKI